jgi:hypothetical protein
MYVASPCLLPRKAKTSWLKPCGFLLKSTGLLIIP